MIVVKEAVNTARPLVSIVARSAQRRRARCRLLRASNSGCRFRLARPTPSAKISIVVLGEPA